MFLPKIIKYKLFFIKNILIRLKNIIVGYQENNIYDKAYILNLNKNVDRFNYIEGQCKLYKIPYERFDAIDCRRISLSKFIKNGYLEKDINKYNINNPGRIGCYLSHILLWEKLYQNCSMYEKQIALILEDDATISADINRILNKFSNYLPSEWDIVFIGSNRLKGKLVNKKILKPKAGNFRGYNSGTFGYLLRINAVPKLTNILLPIDNIHSIDVKMRMNFNRIIGLFFIKKYIIHTNKFKSERNAISS